MPTKKELLKDKTVKKLRQMARDKNLSGYSNMKKSELVDLLAKNYLKAEIEAWPDIDLEIIGEESEAEEREKRIVRFEEIEATRILPMSKRNLAYTAAVLASAIAAIAIVIALYLQA